MADPNRELWEALAKADAGQLLTHRELLLLAEHHLHNFDNDIALNCVADALEGCAVGGPDPALQTVATCRQVAPAFQLPGSVDTLRRVARWVDGVRENVWYPPPPSKAATAQQVLELYALCRKHCVQDPEELLQCGPTAAAAWDAWVVQRGGA